MSSPTVSSALAAHPRYLMVELLKRGALGSIYVSAKDKIHNRLVTLKLVRRSQVGAEGGGGLDREVAQIMRLTHPHLVELKEVFLTPDFVVLVTDHAAGSRPLADALPPGRGLSEEEARWIFSQVLFATEYCHRMGVAIGGVKLEGVWVDQSSSRPIIKLADFTRAVPCTEAGQAENGGAGTQSPFAQDAASGGAACAPPEAAASGRPYDAKKADVWSLGVFLFRLLTGASPFERPGDAGLGRLAKVGALMQRMKAVDYQLPEDLSEPCRDLLAHMLAAEPSKRLDAADLVAHPWCAEGMHPQQLLQCNDVLVDRSLASPPPPTLVREVANILAEAALTVHTPDIGDGFAKALTAESMPSLTEPQRLSSSSSSSCIPRTSR